MNEKLKKVLQTLLFMIFGGGMTFAATTVITKPVILPVEKVSITDVQVEQDRVFDITGSYTQIKTDKTLTNIEYSIEKIPDETVVHVYDGPNGKGYQVITDTASERSSIGFGPEAEYRTWVRIKPQTSTTTEVIKL